MKFIFHKKIFLHFLIFFIVFINTKYIYGNIADEKKYNVNMYLAKYTYKIYEPVYAKFEVINNSNDTMNIYDMFSGKFTGIAIKENNRPYESDYKEHSGFYITSEIPNSKIAPEDTLLISLNINDWAYDTNEISSDVYYFASMGYFRPGIYHAYFYFSSHDVRHYGTELRSNEVKFEVIDLSMQDEELLKICTENKYSVDVDRYSLNTFAEHIFAWRLYISNIIKSDSVVIKEYDKFIYTYPNSYYLMNLKFMNSYIKSAVVLYGNSNIALNSLKNRHNSKLLNKVLSNKAFLFYFRIY